MADYVENAARQVACPACDAPANGPCVTYPSGRTTAAHTMRVHAAAQAGHLDNLTYAELDRP